MTAEIVDQVSSIIAAYDPAAPRTAADALRGFWLQFEPKSVAGIKAQQREQQETGGNPVPVQIRKASWRGRV